MATIVITREGDALDLICFRHYGRQAGAVEPVLEANPHIKDVADRLPAGIEVTLPDLTARLSRKSRPRLWD